MSLPNNKLLERALGILLDIAAINREDGLKLLKITNGSVKLSLLMALSNLDVVNAKQLLCDSGENLRIALNKVN